MRYLITFACYGAHLHGDESGSVDRLHSQVGSRLQSPDPHRVSAERRSMKESPYTLDADHRYAVLDAIREVCSHRDWNLLAAHVRSNHVHIVVEAEARPEKAMNDFKSYASRSLNRLEPARKRWGKHGSTKWLWKDQSVKQAIRYVIEKQGEPMAVFITDVL